MTREEAIKKLELIARITMWNERREAVEMAIEALQAGTVNTPKQVPEACKNCSNHPSNGGSGICFCTLGSMKITC